MTRVLCDKPLFCTYNSFYKTQHYLQFEVLLKTGSLLCHRKIDTRNDHTPLRHLDKQEWVLYCHKNQM